MSVLILFLLVGAQKAVSANEKPIGIILAAGDIVNCRSSRSKYKEVAHIAKTQINEADSRDIPIKVILLGDLVYSNCWEEYKNVWGQYYKYIIPIPGNHDYTDDINQNASSYFDYFKQFYNKIDAKSDNGSFLYFFPDDHPNAWALFGLNYYQDRRAEIHFAEEILSEAGFGCILGFSHPFFLSSGHHGQNTENFSNKNMRPFFDLLYKNHGSLLLTSHDHHFEQFARLDNKLRPAADGLRQFVVGTGGAPLYRRNDSRHPNSEYVQNTDHGMLKLVLFADRYEWDFIEIEGADKHYLPIGREDCNSP